MRPPSACVACRTRRRRCDVAANGSSCTWCESRLLQCSFSQLPPDTTEQSMAEQFTSQQSTNNAFQNDMQAQQVPSKSTCMELIELYFQYIHDTFHSLFHRPSLIQDFLDDKLPPVLLYGIISLSARFSSDPYFAGVDPRIRGRPFGAHAQSLLNLREVSLTTIQACVLLGAFVITEGESDAEAVFYSAACRNALLLNLPNMSANSQLEEEVHRRVWWSLCMIDVWSSKGVGIPCALEPREDVPYPMEETKFLRLRRDEMQSPLPSTASPYAPSLLTQMVKLNNILFDISSLNESAAVATSPYSDYDTSHDDTVETLNGNLQKWFDSIPAGLQDTSENMIHYAALGLGPMFVAVYLGYYHYGALLNYRYLHADSSEMNIVASVHADKCRQFSTRLCEILYRAYSTPGCDVYYTMVGHVLVIASTVQLHILMFGTNEEEIKAARGRLERNFEILTRLQTFWPTLDICVTRFKEFHRACEKSSEASFRMDRWMSRFLYEFAKPVGDRDPDKLAELSSWSMEDLGFSPFDMTDMG